MFKMITWPQFFGAVAVLLVLYYAYVALVYYRAELIGLLTGKGSKATGSQASPTPPTSLLNRGPLIPKAAIVLPVPEAVVVSSDTDMDEEGQEAEADDTPATVEVDTGWVTEEAAESANDDFNRFKEINTDKISKFTTSESDLDPATPQDESTNSTEDGEENFMVSVTQLNSVFDRAAAGKITQQQLTEEVPGLVNTQVLEAFYQQSKKRAQQLTAATYAEVAEPVLS
ncbi:hypothetical protein [Hymenobacter sp. BT491]|uniref:hypothetical protein n=1 Tax=Hymenobacter sp. BT491 TaxID=2766779 RepID=UPI0016537088|nr:hypothetical protein [Hymenobacter sp. BT491]MBC6992506.1 hypothetical protein [Hymenobacter sp. BT491]